MSQDRDSAHRIPFIPPQHRVSARTRSDEFGGIASSRNHESEGLVAVHGGSDMKLGIVERRGRIEDADDRRKAPSRKLP
jgi:hypothetical protein